jgi:hypothetical protein
MKATSVISKILVYLDSTPWRLEPFLGLNWDFYHLL